jgi:ABC-type ATPase involved in cell division
MVIRITISLDEDAFDFLKQVSGNNKSAYINTLLKREKLKSLEESIKNANIKEANDLDYQKELSNWL